MGEVTRQSDGLWGLTNVNDETPWFDLTNNIDSWGYQVDIVGAGDTVVVRVSEQTSKTKDKYVTIDTWTSDSGRRRMPRDSGSFVKFIKTAGTNGSVSTVGVGTYLNGDGKPTPISGQGNLS
jgi:hypothetical protein